MERIIEFIAGNLFFIVIALGFLTSLLKKGNDEKGKNGRQDRRPPGPGEQRWPGSSPAGRPATGRTQSSVPAVPKDDPFGKAGSPIDRPGGPFGIPGGPFGGPGGPFDFPGDWLEPDFPQQNAKGERIDDEAAWNREAPASSHKTSTKPDRGFSDEPVLVESRTRADEAREASPSTTGSPVGMRSWAVDSAGLVQPSRPKVQSAGIAESAGAASATSDAMSPIYRPESAEEMSRQAMAGMIWAEIYGPPLAKRRMLSRGRRTF